MFEICYIEEDGGGGEAEVGGRLPRYVVAMVGQDWKITYDGRGSLDEGVA